MTTADASVVAATTPGKKELPTKIDVKNLQFYYGAHHAVKNVNLPLYSNKVTALIGPSG